MTNELTTAPRDSKPGNRRTPGTPQLALLLAGSCLPILGAVLLAPVLPQMNHAFRGTPGHAVLVPVMLTLPALFVAIVSPFAGFVLDKVDRKRILIAAMVAYSVFGTAPLYLGSLHAILVSRALVGICEAAIMTACTTLIGDYWSGAKRARYLGLQTLVTALSATAFLAIGGALGSAGWRTPFWLYLAGALLAIPMARLLWQPTAPAAHGPESLEPLPWKRLATPLLTSMIGGVLFYTLIVELSFVLDHVGVASTAAIGAISALMSLATAVGAGSFSKVSHSTPRVLLPIAFGATAAGFALVSVSSAVPLITVGAVLSGAGTGLLLPTLLTWSVGPLTFRQRGRGTGVWMGMLFIGEFMTPLVVAAATAAIGGLQPAIGLLGVVALAMTAFALIVLRHQRTPLNHSAE